ncbi:hypothetical protein IAU60_005098 [Kwoniella sp. DSM 27419]
MKSLRRESSSSSSSFLRNMVSRRHSTPPPPLTLPQSNFYPQDPSYPRSQDSGPRQPSRQRLGLPLVVSLVTTALFLISLFADPDPSLHHTLQFPGLLPSKPARIQIHDPSIARYANSTYTEYLAACPGGSAPVFLNPALSPKQERRYSGLKKRKGRYMLVSNTRQISDHLPDLLNSIIVLSHFLGPDKLSFSILEGPSSDCTPRVLKEVLLPLLSSLGVSTDRVRIHTDEPKIDWSRHNRIEKIAELRNRALSPLWDEGWGSHTEAVVFFNDVYIHAADVLELLYQHVRSHADITSGMDWWKKRPEYYYDIWVGRTIDSGDLFYPIDWTWWSPSDNLFPTSPSTMAKYQTLEPFQVYSTWNAMAVLSPEPFLPPHNVRFRRSDKTKDECAASECTLIAADYWKVGHGKVQVVPSVQFAYERDVALDIMEDLAKQKLKLGWVDGVPPAALDTAVEPPEKVRCHPWPEVNGLSANIWEETRWVEPFLP